MRRVRRWRPRCPCSTLLTGLPPGVRSGQRARWSVRREGRRIRAGRRRALGHHEGAEHDRSWLEAPPRATRSVRSTARRPPGRATRRAGSRMRRRSSSDSPAESVAPRIGCALALARRGTIRQVFEHGEHVGARACLAAPPGLRTAELRLLAEKLRRERVEQAADHRVLRDPAPERVDDADPARSDDLEEPGNAEQGVGPKLDRVAVGVVDAPDHHVDPFEAGERPEPEPAVLDDEIAAFGEGVAEIRGEVGMLERRSRCAPRE